MGSEDEWPLPRNLSPLQYACDKSVKNVSLRLTGLPISADTRKLMFMNMQPA